jgi:hypothetical protein
VENGIGTVEQSLGNVTSITVNCNATVSANNYVLGTVSGLASGSTVTLIDNGTDTTVVNSNGAFAFPSALPVGSVYNVVVSVQPTGQTCTVANSAGTIPASGTIVPVAVTCN